MNLNDLTDKYVNFVADIVKEYMGCDITDSDCGFCQITSKNLDKSSQLWGMDFMEKDKSKSYIFVRCEICINKTLASNYKKDYLSEFENIAKTFKAGATNKKYPGTLYTNKEVTSYKECELIYQSPAGLYERKVDLLKV